MTPPISTTGSQTEISGGVATAAAPRHDERALRAKRLGLLGHSDTMRMVLARLEKVAASDLPVLVRGETGTGKELAAKAIHDLSARRNGPFVSENCAALADGLLEAELFGHEKGAFTGAIDTREGLFHRAHGGTLFIDEVGDMSPAMQAKLLRVLQEGEVRRVGGAESVKVDVRVIAATHRHLDEMVRDGRFRADLLFRLHVLEVSLPPLRDRLDDVPLLAEHFLDKVAAETPGKRPLLLSEAALDSLLAHEWPGNVRELENAIRVAALFSPGPALDAGALPIPSARAHTVSVAAAAALVRMRGDGDKRLTYDELRAALDERERRYIRAVLDEERGNKARAARRLGVTRYALYRVLRRLGIECEEPVGAAS
jgi:transcriptional regulator with GAF, ATPase, and Fis domain